MDERIQTILDPGGALGNHLAQSGMMDYQKHLIGIMEAAGAAALTRGEQIAGNLIGRVFGKIVPGSGYLIDAAQAAEAVKESHKEGIEQMDARGVAGFDTGTIRVENPTGSGEPITMRYWVDASAEEFGGRPRVYMEPGDEATQRLIDQLERTENDSALRKLDRLERLAEDMVESRALDEVHGVLAQGRNYGAEVSRGLQDIQSDFENGRLQLSSVETNADVQIAEVEQNQSVTSPPPSMSV